VKGASGRHENRGEAEGGCCGMNEGADGDSRGRDDARFAALADGAAEDVEDGWAWDEEENEGTGEKERIG